MQSINTNFINNYLKENIFSEALKKINRIKFLISCFLIAIVSVLNYACQNPVDQASYEVSFIKGTALDFNQLSGIDSVTLSLDLNTLSTYSDSLGNYRFYYIRMPRDQMNVNLTASKNGYETRNISIYVHSNDTSSCNFYLKHF